MFGTGDVIVCGGSGVCIVEAVGEIPISGCEGKTYYTLRPVYGSGVSYLPVDTNQFMRRVMTPEEANGLIDRIPGIKESGFADRSPRALKEHYGAYMKSHSAEELVTLIKEIYSKGTGRKLSRIEQQYMTQAEELLYGELAVALDIPRSEVVDYITKRLGKALA